MPATYEPIASQTLGGSATTITFSDIPGTFTDLIIAASPRLTFAGQSASLALRLNGDTGSNYSTTWIRGNGTSAESSRLSNQSEMYVATISASTAASNIFTPCIVSICSYSNANVHKTVLSSSSGIDYGPMRLVNLWRSTSVVTSISLRSFGGTQGDFASGSTFSLYGIKAA